MNKKWCSECKLNEKSSGKKQKSRKWIRDFLFKCFKPLIKKHLKVLIKLMKKKFKWKRKVSLFTNKILLDANIVNVFLTKNNCKLFITKCCEE